MKILALIAILGVTGGAAGLTPAKPAAKEKRRAEARRSTRPTVALDVKDADVREILRSMQKQCGVKNMVIDPGVSGSGTFYFRDVPCDAAFRIVLRTMGLAGQVEPNSVVTVGIPKG